MSNDHRIFPYSHPPFQSLRCPCGVRFVVLVSGDDSEHAARAEAQRLGADFVDGRKLLAFECYCGAWLDICDATTYGSPSIQ